MKFKKWQVSLLAAGFFLIEPMAYAGNLLTVTANSSNIFDVGQYFTPSADVNSPYHINSAYFTVKISGNDYNQAVVFDSVNYIPSGGYPGQTRSLYHTINYSYTIPNIYVAFVIGNQYYTGGMSAIGGRYDVENSRTLDKVLNLSKTNWYDPLNPIYYTESYYTLITSTYTNTNGQDVVFSDYLTDLTSLTENGYINFMYGLSSMPGYTGVPKKPFATLTVDYGHNPPAVPEPESLTMLLAGLGLIGFMSARKKAI